MSYESGVGSNGVPFEYGVNVKNSKTKLKKAAFILAYVAYVGGVFAVGAVAKIIAPMLALVPLSLWVIVWITWRYTQVSYEYSFFQGELTVKRCFGSRTKKMIAKVKIKDITKAVKCGADKDKELGQALPEKVVDAASSQDSPDLMLILYTDSNKEENALYFETNENALRILKYYNSNLF